MKWEFKMSGREENTLYAEWLATVFRQKRFIDLDAWKRSHENKPWIQGGGTGPSITTSNNQTVNEAVKSTNSLIAEKEAIENRHTQTARITLFGAKAPASAAPTLNNSETLSKKPGHN